MKKKKGFVHTHKEVSVSEPWDEVRCESNLEDHLESIREAIDCAMTCETATDFDANLADIENEAAALLAHVQSLQTERKQQKEAHEQETRSRNS